MKRPAISLEFFPPRDVAARERLIRSAKQLMGLHPEYVSVTFGAGGSTRGGTLETLQMLQTLGCTAAPHLSCVGASRAFLAEMLDQYQALGVTRIVALRGDLPSGMGGDSGELHYANELVAFIREHSGDHFHIEVAAYPEAHPQATSAAEDLGYFVGKLRAGADSAITQYFFNADAYFDFVDRLAAQGVATPVVPGIMPITNAAQLLRFSNICGAEVPRWLRLRLTDFGEDKASLRDFGVDFVADLCRRLLEGGAPGLHFYTLNQAAATQAICTRLGLAGPVTVAAPATAIPCR
ncbi:MAG: methylenetetrahydrofolate reductase [NAD(P)H] [Castellaniella sp.]